MLADQTGQPAARTPIAAYVLLGVCLAYAVWVVSIGWHNTILDFLGFRQTQTALTAYFMASQPPKLAYETPVVGPPWSIPFEFPIYQWIVAAVVGVAGTPMDETGRAVSLMFFLLALLPAYRILAWLGLTRPHRLIALSLFVVSPFYLFWSRTFLIESTALFFSLCYLAASLPAVDEPRPMRLIVALLFGVLAALVKITTCFVFSLLIGLYLMHVWLASGRACLRSALLCRTALLALLLLGVPFAAGWSWTRFADEQKALNPIGRHLTTSAELMRKWNYGTREQRRERDTWELIWERTNYALGHRSVLAFAALALVLTRRRWRTFLVCLLVYPIAPLVFTNLYWFHEYYAYANNVLLLAATAISLIALLERGGIYRAVGLAGLTAFLAMAVWRHQTYYAPIQAYNHEELNAVSRTIQRVTHADDAIVVLGCDWSSEVPYYSRRRALCVPFWLNPSLEKLPEYLSMEPPYRVGAVVIRKNWLSFERTAVENAIRQAGFGASYHRADEEFAVYAVKRLSP